MGWAILNNRRTVCRRNNVTKSKTKPSKGLRQDNSDIMAKIIVARRTWAILKNICFPNI